MAMLMRYLVVLFLLVGILSPSFVAAQEKTPVQQATELIRQGQFPEALQLLDQAKIANPNDAETYFLSGMILYRTDQHVQGLNELEKAVNLAPDSPQYLLTFAELLLKTGYHFRALELMKPAAQRFQPDQLSAEQNWFFSDLLFRMGENEASLRFLEPYATAKPEDERVYFREAQIHLLLNELDKSLESFEEAYLKTLRKAAARYGKGLVLFQRGDIEDSRTALNEAVELEPENPEYVHLFAQVLFSLGEADSALNSLQRVESQADQYPKIYDALARVYRQRGEQEKAADYSRKFRERDTAQRTETEAGQKISGTLREAQDLFNAGKLQDARRKFTEVLTLEPDNFMAHSYLVEIYLSASAWTMAFDHLQRLQAIDPEAFEGNYLMAAYYYQRGEPSQALTYGEKAKSLQPGLASLRNLLGNIYYALQDLESAVEEYEAAATLDPDRTEFRLNLESARSQLK